MPQTSEIPNYLDVKDLSPETHKPISSSTSLGRIQISRRRRHICDDIDIKGLSSKRKYINSSNTSTSQKLPGFLAELSALQNRSMKKEAMAKRVFHKVHPVSKIEIKPNETNIDSSEIRLEDLSVSSDESIDEPITQNALPQLDLLKILCSTPDKQKDLQLPKASLRLQSTTSNQESPGESSRSQPTKICHQF